MKKINKTEKDGVGITNKLKRGQENKEKKKRKQNTSV
jgi:hypothetical protein